MTCIVKIEGYNGFHEYESQSHRTSNWMGDGWIEVPDAFVPTLYDCEGYCDLQIEDGVLTGITPTERPELEPEPYVPTLEERITALELAQLYSMGVETNV